ncbi:Permease of the drug/metabolite transporter (DMT) superfamily [Paracoccus isoporae]|uniref:Permease of the drug/metabolite transporter (DMT) superfamily n=1 Tax=Paracoccus isoporae TaxID=591205 RepID=A0A1G7EQ84_9RHOB|nr:DMT family transporter [Paracoccus isoporae]SDE65848.1 Permease of the drug/metabolite transporter (DMT) superfamily [Paracoccus isoporae]
MALRPLPGAFALFGRERDGSRRHPGGDQTRGILILCSAIFLFTLMDATAKYLGQYYSAPQVVWARFMGNLAVVLLVYRARFFPLLRARRPMFQFWRAMTQLASVSLFFTSLQYIGIAEATAIMDLNPVLITLGGALFLGERIGWRRIAGIVAAMIGALIIIRPGLGVFHPAALLPLIGAFTFAAGALLTRMVRHDALGTSLIWSVVVGAIASSAAVPFFWDAIQTEHLWAYGLIGLFGAASQALLIRAFSLAEAGAIAPFGYTGVIWAGVWGWLFWGVLPDLWTIFGAVLIVGAGIYIWSREKKLAEHG